MSKLFISTTIPYVNGDPHIGHALEYVQTDAVARYQRFLGNDVYFLSGTDENSLKNVQAAEKANKSIKEFIDEKAQGFLNFKKSLNISFDDFIRTTEKRHFDGAKKFWQDCKPDDIYKKEYRGLYCVGCEAFYTESELADGLCPEHKKVPEIVEEENYFFRLSNYQKEIEKIIENDVIKIFPANKKNETLAFVKRGLEDFSISRSMERAHGWGVPVPGDEEQIMYVWFDALTNYITALNYAGDQKLFKKYWEQENKKERRVAHVLGKGVSRFHLVYWVGMLLSAGVKLPTEEFIHGYVTVNNEKMSKSLGNVLNPHDLVSKYGTDMLRYYLLGAVSPYQDGDFSIARFEEFYQAHLANGVGNLTSRILTMVEKYCDSKVPKEAKDIFDTKKFWQNYEKFFNEYRFDEVVKLTQELVGKCDEKISSEKPWEKAKNGEDISGLLYQLAETLRHIALALLPIIPGSAEKILTNLGVALPKKASQRLHAEGQIRPLAEVSLGLKKKWSGLKKGATINKGEAIFPRL